MAKRLYGRVHNQQRFDTLEDTPATYVGSAGKRVIVNSAENALEFGNEFPAVVNDDAANRDILATDAGSYIRMTKADGAKTVTFQFDATEPLANGDEFTIRNAAAENLTLTPDSVAISGDTTDTSADVVMTSLVGINVGDPVTGTGVPDNTTVLAVTPAVLPATDDTITMSNAATATGTVTLTFSRVTLNAPASGTLVLAPSMTVTVKRVAADVFDVFGQTVAA